MVAQRGDVVVYGIHHLGLHHALEHGEIRGALAEVPAVQDERPAGIGLADGIHESGALDDAAESCVRAAAFRLEMAVGVIHVDYHKPGLRGAGSQYENGTEYQCELFHIPSGLAVAVSPLNSTLTLSGHPMPLPSAASPER